MAGLVEEIQALALDDTVKVQDLLRRVKLAATKLQLQDTATWVDRKIKGYQGVAEQDMPVYRVCYGRLMQQHTFHGRRTAHGDPKAIAALSMVFLREPMSSLEALAAGDGNDLMMHLEPEIEAQIHAWNDNSSWSYYVQFGKSTVVGIIARVRDLVLEWAMELEQQGILGEGISFSVAEKQKAQEVAPNITIHSLQGNFVNGDIGGNQNRLNAYSHDLSANKLDMDSTFQSLSQAIDTQVGDPEDKQVLLEIVKSMQSSKGGPDYAALYQQLLANGANCMTVLTPFLPALTAYLAS